jgi:hypothetical protein
MKAIYQYPKNIFKRTSPKLFLLIALIAGTVFSSCEGPQGVPGPQGAPGYNVEAQVYEITNVNFTAPSYGIFFTFPQQTLASDHALVYRLSAIDGGNDVWQLIPQYFYNPDGTMDFGYNNDATINDVNIYLDGENLGTLVDGYRLNQVFRVVIVPGQFANKSTGLQNQSYESVTAALKITDADFKKASQKYQN